MAPINSLSRYNRSDTIIERLKDSIKCSLGYQSRIILIVIAKITSAYRLVRAELFPVVRVGRCYRIPADSFFQWMNRQCQRPSENDAQDLLNVLHRENGSGIQNIRHLIL